MNFRLKPIPFSLWLHWNARSTCPTNLSRLSLLSVGYQENHEPAPKQEIETLVDRILTAKQADPAADVHALEAQIDHLVYQLYNLTPEEMSLVEGGICIDNEDALCQR